MAVDARRERTCSIGPIRCSDRCHGGFGTYMDSWLLCFGLCLEPIRRARSPRGLSPSLLHLPRYAVWKLTLGLSPRPSSWVRTAREPRSDGLQEKLMRPLPQHKTGDSEKQTEASAPACRGISPSEQIGNAVAESSRARCQAMAPVSGQAVDDRSGLDPGPGTSPTS